MKKKTKTVEMVKSSYQPTKAEQQEEFMTDASLEQIADAVLSPVDIRWIDKPRNRRKLVRREVEPRSCLRYDYPGFP